MYLQAGTSKKKTVQECNSGNSAEDSAKFDGDGSGNNARRVRVLVVEDHAVLRESLRMYFEIMGYEATGAAGYEEALKAADDFSPDVAICDRQLDGERDGVDVARDLQRNVGCAIVFVSGTSMESLRSETRDLEVAAYLKKPVFPDRIERTVRSVAHGRNQQ